MLLIRGADGEKNKRWFKDDPEPRLKKDIITMVSTPESKSKTKRHVMVAGLKAMQENQIHAPVKCAVVLDMVCVFAPNVSDTRAMKDMKSTCRVPMVKKPDIDNIAKGVLDGLNGIVYHDDAQVMSLNVLKVYGPISGLRARVYRADIASLSTSVSDLFPDGIGPPSDAGPLFLTG